MEILPAIDLRDGKCVRLIQGDYGRETIFGDPTTIARHWESLGATRLHVVDLDGAKAGRPTQLDTIASIVKSVHIPIELGGGIRTEEAAQCAFTLGIERVIVGTAALDRTIVSALATALGPALVAGIDARDGMVAVRGWLETTRIKATDLARELATLGIGWIVYTDIVSDGMLRGANLAAMREMVEAVPKTNVIASGGITSVDDIKQLKKAGAAAAIIGMALYTGVLDLRDALEAAC